MSDILSTESGIIDEPVLKRKSEDEVKEVRGGLSATALKMVAVICMIIDHLAAFILYRMIAFGIIKTNVVLFEVGGMRYSPERLIYYVMRGIGKISFPLFAFFIVEGFMHTKSRAKYLARLLVFALISQLPFAIAFEGLGKSFGHLMIPTNVLYTLALGLIVIWGADTLKKYAPGGFVAVCFRILVCIVPTAYVAYEIYRILCINDSLALQPMLFGWIWLGIGLAVFFALYIYGKFGSKENARAISSSVSLLGFGMIIADLLETDYSSIGVLIIFVMYVMAKRNKTAGMTIGVTLLSLNNLIELPAFADVFLISRYNGKRGKNWKYFFYIFYPAHLAIIVLVLYITKLI